MPPEGRSRALFDIRRSELPLALLMFTYFFLVITSFWILKPLKTSLFIEFYDQSGFDLLSFHLSAPQAELLAKVLNMGVAFVAVVVFTWLARRFRRQQLTFLFTAFFLASYLAYGFVISSPGGAVIWSFYLFGDLFSTLMVATFFAFLNDSVTPDAAKRLYGLVGLGGVTGGVFGSMAVSTLIASVSEAGWLRMCFALGLMIVAVAWGAGRMVERDPPPEPAPEPPEAEPRKSGSPALEGAALVARSPYLLAIVAIVGLYEIVSTMMDFQFKSTVSHYLDGPAIRQQISTVYAITNGVSLVVQVFFTSFVMTRFGVGIALLVLPFAALAGSASFLAVPVLWIGSALNTADNAFSYSINQSAKETLYVPTSKDEKYKAKAFIDMFVQRFAKSVAVVVTLAITTWFRDFESVRWLSVITIPVVALWIFAARYGGRRFSELSGEEPPA